MRLQLRIARNEHWTADIGEVLRVSWLGKSAGLPILNPAFYPRDHCAPDFADHDQRKGSEEI
jgi:hypothetical protein